MNHILNSILVSIYIYHITNFEFMDPQHIRYMNVFYILAPSVVYYIFCTFVINLGLI